MRILIVDDDLIRHQAFQKKLASYGQVDGAYNYYGAIKQLEDIAYDVIFLDHDLGDGKSGYNVAVWIDKNLQDKLWNTLSIYVHSMNPVGAKNIQEVLPYAELVPGYWLSPVDNPDDEEDEQYTSG